MASSHTVCCPLDRLVVMRGLLDVPLVAAMRRLLLADVEEEASFVDAYASFAHLFFETGASGLREALLRLATDDDNIYLRSMSAGTPVARTLRTAVDADLRCLREAADTLEAITSTTAVRLHALPVIPMDGDRNLVPAYHRRMSSLGCVGHGAFANHALFLVDDAGELVPVAHPSGIRLSDHVGYEAQQEELVRNTKAFVAGKPAADVLLLGESGTGKSSSVRALAHEFFADGLRIVELGVDQLALLPSLMDRLANNLLRFVLFVDDLQLAWPENERYLQDALEGAAVAKAGNVVVYATYTWSDLADEPALVRAFYGDADAEDAEVACEDEAIVDLPAVIDRFGLCLEYDYPDTDTYLAIVAHVAQLRGLSLDVQDMERVALDYAEGLDDWSGRRAKQFVDDVQVGLQIVADVKAEERQSAKDEGEEASEPSLADVLDDDDVVEEPAQEDEDSDGEFDEELTEESEEGHEEPEGSDGEPEQRAEEESERSVEGSEDGIQEEPEISDDEPEDRTQEEPEGGPEDASEELDGEEPKAEASDGDPEASIVEEPDVPQREDVEEEQALDPADDAEHAEDEEPVQAASEEEAVSEPEEAPEEPSSTEGPQDTEAAEEGDLATDDAEERPEGVTEVEEATDEASEPAVHVVDKEPPKTLADMLPEVDIEEPAQEDEQVARPMPEPAEDDAKEEEDVSNDTASTTSGTTTSGGGRHLAPESSQERVDQARSGRLTGIWERMLGKSRE